MEHEVSLQSAKNVVRALDKKKYEPILIGIDKKGVWHLSGATRFLLNAGDPELIRLSETKREMAVLPGEDKQRFVLPAEKQSAGRIDVVFPVLHGPYGEDGTIQGMLKLAGVPFVGAGVLGSAVGMDKDVMKRLLRSAGLPTPKFLVCRRLAEADFKQAKKILGLPVFVKPANAGSSVGINKAKTELEFKAAVKNAFKYDRKILVEETIRGRELECSVLGNEKPIASVPGEVIPAAKHGFYSYAAKYLDENGAALEIPAKLPRHLIKEVKKLAKKAFLALECEGMARVDFFLTPRGKLLINEINTIPGFTNISMYPKLWEASGIPQSELIDRLIKLALERFEKEQKLRTTYL